MASLATNPFTPAPSPTLTQNYAITVEQEVIDWTEQLYKYAVTDDKDREKRIRDTFKIIKYLDGEQWSANARYARSRPVINKFFRHFWEGVGLLTDLSLDFTVNLFNRIDNFSDLEKLLNSLAVHWALRSDFDNSLYDVILYGLLNTGWAKMQWNSSLNGGLGDNEMRSVAPWNIATIGTASDPQAAECMIYYDVVSLNHLLRTYGPVARRVQPDEEYSGGGAKSSFAAGDSLRPSHIGRDQWNRMGGLLRSLVTKRSGLDVEQSASMVSPMTQNCLLKEFWLRDDSINEGSQTIVVGPADASGKPKYNWCYYVEPGEKLYPRGRVVVTAGSVVLEDNPNPYWHGQFPFTSFRPYRVPWALEGMSPTRPYLQMQNITNRIWGGVLDMIKSIIEPTLIAPKAAFSQADWDALDPGMSGGKIKYNNNTPRPPEYAKKEHVPPEMLPWKQEVDKEMDINSGTSAIAQALGKNQVPGGDSLETILSTRATPARVQARALTQFVKSAGFQGVCNILQFYSVAHRVAIVGGEGIMPSDFRPIYGSLIPSGMKPENYVQKFQGTIKCSTQLASERLQKIQLALQMRQQGDLSQYNLFRIIGENFDMKQNRQELIEEAKLKVLLAGAAASATGKK